MVPGIKHRCQRPPVEFVDEVSGMAEVERGRLEIYLAEWRGFWKGLLLAAAAGAVLIVVVLAVCWL